jgi:3-phosphoglycerate kinase
MKFVSEFYKLKDQTVLLRADLDAPSENGRILDDYRIRSAIPTIEYLLKRGSKIVILSKNGHDHNESLELVAQRLAELLNRKLVVAEDKMPEYDAHHLIFFKGDLRDQKNLDLIKSASDRDIVLLENIRFYEEEKEGDIDFAKHLASLGDIFVSDAFAMMHRNEVSVALLPNYMPSYAGLSVEKELKGLNNILNMKANPFIVVMGGAKITDKVGAIKNLGRKADQILLGGGPANLFFLAKGYEIGQSICERDQLKLAEDLLRNFKSKIILPVDVIAADPKDITKMRVCAPDKVKKSEAIYDIGPKTILEFSKYIKPAKKLVWNGPMGWFEKPQFSHGTLSMAMVYSSRCKGQAFGMVGGGDTLEAVNKAKVAEHIDFISTAGSATLDYLAEQELPGLKALELSRK